MCTGSVIIDCTPPLGSSNSWAPTIATAGYRQGGGSERVAAYPDLDIVACLTGGVSRQNGLLTVTVLSVVVSAAARGGGVRPRHGWTDAAAEPQSWFSGNFQMPRPWVAT
ncbi:hypothetical protein [Hamadaea tsunoensis]|uniref:hypothetical protein n=1 Tax=Hamadaea tsunoensis TaxID=53368 RepID=UPI0004839E9C|nr:hypothetical protein [Hamadaea tsunoensis]